MTEAQDLARSDAFSKMTDAEHRLHAELHFAAIDIKSIPKKLEGAREEVKLMNEALTKSIASEAAALVEKKVGKRKATTQAETDEKRRR